MFNLGKGLTIWSSIKKILSVYFRVHQAKEKQQIKQNSPYKKI